MCWAALTRSATPVFPVRIVTINLIAGGKNSGIGVRVRLHRRGFANRGGY